MQENGITPGGADNDALRARVLACMRRDSLSRRGLAAAVGYSRAAITMWLDGKYDRDERRLRAALTRWVEQREALVTPWHPVDIKAALYKRDLSLAELARRHDVSLNAMSRMLRRPNPAIERLVADAIEVEPWVIWPDRYDAFHRPRAEGRPS